MTPPHHSLAHHGSLSFGQALSILGNGHVGFATDHKPDGFVMHLPQILSIQIASIDDNCLNLSSASQILLSLLQQGNQPFPLVVLDVHDLHGQWKTRLDFNQDQDFPPIHVILLCDRFFLSFDFHLSRLFHLATSLITLGGWELTPIQGDQQLTSPYSSVGQYLHHLIEEPLHLFLRQFADIVRQTLGGDRPLFLFRFALSLSAFGQSLGALLCIETYQLHQRQIAKEHTWKLIHRLTSKEDLEEIQQHQLHRWHKHPLHCRQAYLLKRLQHADLFQIYEKFIQESCITKLVHLFYLFACIPFPLRAFVHLPCPFFPRLPLSPPPHNPLYQNVSTFSCNPCTCITCRIYSSHHEDKV